MADEAEEARLALGLLAPSGSGRRRASAPPGDGEHAQALAACARGGATLDAAPHGAVERRARSRRRPPIASQRREHLLGRALRVHARARRPRSSTVDISRSVGSKWNSSPARALARARRGRPTPSRAAASSSAISVGSPRDFPAVRRPSSALLQAAAARRRAGRARRRAGADRSSPSPVALDRPPSGVQTRDGAHPVLGQRPGLVGADHGRRAERLDRAKPLDERAAAGEPPHADGERERDRRQQALGDVRDDAGRSRS